MSTTTEAEQAEALIKSRLDGTFTSMVERQNQYRILTERVALNYLPNYDRLIGKRMKGGGTA